MDIADVPLQRLVHTWSLTAIGGTHVCLREVRGDAIWQQLSEHGVTHLNAAPTVVSTILNAAEAGPLARRVLITTAGAPPSPTTIARMERWVSASCTCTG